MSQKKDEKYCPTLSVERNVPCLGRKCQLWDSGVPNIYEANCGKIPRQDRRIEK
ncbi:MAG: hypothetical protein WA137_06315 [Methanothrix sp.]